MTPAGSTASKVPPPTNTDMRANSLFSAGSSRS